MGPRGAFLPPDPSAVVLAITAILVSLAAPELHARP